MHIKKLRYYDSIGILPPVYINKETGYRYYSISQIAIANAIEFCQELEIPLSDMKNFLDVENTSIDFEMLKNRGKEILQERIERLENAIKRIEALEGE